MDNFEPRPMNQKKSKVWFAIVIIVVLAVLAYLVYFVRIISNKEPIEPIVNQLESQGISDEVSAIEQDLTGTVLNGLDSEVSDIEKELQNLGL